jgi:transcriptional regulator with XRE-family HTH domain
MTLRSKEKLGDLIKSLRGDQSQRSFAKSLGVSFASIQAWENGDSMPSTENLSIIASKAGYTLQGLLAYLEDQPIPKSNSLDEIVMQIKSLPLKQVVLIDRAVSDRLVAIAESAGR